MNMRIICDLNEIIATIKNDNNAYSSIYFFQYGISKHRNNAVFEHVRASHIKYIIISNPSNINDFTRLVDDLMSIDVKHEKIIYITDDLYKIKSQIAACVYEYTQPKIFGVTGTDGKTSTCIFLAQMLAAKFLKVGYIGSIGVKIFEFHPETSKFTMKNFYECEVSSLTTPDAFTLHRILRDLSVNGIQYATLEVSSHAIAQSRVNEVVFESLGLTNITSDHLDYHHTVEEYFSTKVNFLKDFITNTDKYIVLNRDVEYYSKIVDCLCTDRVRYITYGENEESDISIGEFNPSKDVTFNIKVCNHIVHFLHRFLPFFQIQNITCAFGLLVASFMNDDDVIELINTVAKNIQNIIAPPGRCEVVCHKNNTDSIVIVDYAHTSHAILTLLLETKNFMVRSDRFAADSKIIIVFGCGGDRDSTKRSVMGQICHEYADICIVTDDNPRSEDPGNIRKEIMTTCINGISIANRQEAIQYGFNLLEKNDILIIAGQGCDRYQTSDGSFTSDPEEVLKCNSVLKIN
ncbi:Mur ligase family protein [Candidatus Fokinia crypta]|uniref:UDP-N-acetylmuramoyl-L-alanyl-D-glutamate--2, 6-diaminopimelate ligase n=1 Tax=Candidatus Fokinia crypta TaxID=1920990 RepID=A0ABZ0UQX0_9RICK|nr:UDP-N-acetylmuramyl-tripeptide synthetase [Candidatus Fokinia cryptica]WPX98104.1 UDP-N-acetylmuramoyl-L-alanyl-D-glutamate--2,6-diaminopimelate ligase [Candidatus Fokinia cryptica]